MANPEKMLKALNSSFAALLLVLPLAVPVAFAQDEDVLHPEEAYRYAVADTGDTIEIDWVVEDGYYLYRNKMSYASNTDSIVLGEVVLPEGLHHEDEFFGVQQIYRDRFYVSIPYTLVGDAPASMELVIKSQGCVDIGLCYPPQSWTESVELLARNGGSEKIKLGNAGTFGTFGGANADFLPVEEAFEPILTALDGNTIEVAIRVAAGYYLYKDKISASVHSGKVQPGKLELPAGEMKTDQYFGDMEVYHSDVFGRLPMARATPEAMDLELEIKYQGCADGGICYPPVTRLMTVALPEATAVSALATVASAGVTAAPVSDWVMPNADASGYYRWSLASEDQQSLMDAGWPQLTDRERLSVAMNLEAGFHAGALPADAVFTALAPLAADRARLVAQAPMRLVALAREQLVAPEARPRVQRFAQTLYMKRYRALGWDVQPGEGGETKLLRRAVIHFLAFTARDAEVRREALRRGRVHLGLETPAAGEDALDAELIDTALAVAVQDGNARIFDELLGRLPGERDAIERTRILRALGAARDPEQAERARSLALDTSLRTNEVFTTLRSQAGQLETREASWDWVTSHFEALVQRAGSSRARSIPWLASSQCSEEEALALEAFLGPHIDALEGGPRNLAGAAEAIRLCAALRERRGPDTRAFFAE